MTQELRLGELTLDMEGVRFIDNDGLNDGDAALVFTTQQDGSKTVEVHYRMPGGSDWVSPQMMLARAVLAFIHDYMELIMAVSNMRTLELHGEDIISELLSRGTNANG